MFYLLSSSSICVASVVAEFPPPKLKTFHCIPIGLLRHPHGALVRSLGTMPVTVLGSSEKFKGMVYMILFHLSLFMRPWPHNLTFQLPTAQ